MILAFAVPIIVVFSGILIRVIGLSGLTVSLRVKLPSTVMILFPCVSAFIKEAASVTVTESICCVAVVCTGENADAEIVRLDSTMLTVSMVQSKCASLFFINRSFLN